MEINTGDIVRSVVTERLAVAKDGGGQTSITMRNGMSWVPKAEERLLKKWKDFLLSKVDAGLMEIFVLADRAFVSVTHVLISSFSDR